MSAFEQYIPDDDSDLDLPPGETADQFDAAPDDDQDDGGDPFVDDAEDDGPLPSEQRDWEAEAKAMGWRDPKETGRGADAKSFVLGSRKEGERLLTQVDTLTQNIRDMQRNQRRSEIQARADGYRRALHAIRAERERARSQYDVEAMERAYASEQELMSRARQEAEVIQREQYQEQIMAQQAAENAPDPVWDAWVAENQWYEKNPELQKMADDVGAVFAARGLTGRALMDQVAQALRTAHPDKFSNPRRRRAPVNDSNGAQASGAPLRAMPNEVRAAFTDFYEEHKSAFESKAKAQKYFLDHLKG